jgi:uncharacterized protein YaaQ
MPESPVGVAPQPKSGMVADIFADMPADDLLRLQSKAGDLRKKTDVDDAAMVTFDEIIATAGKDRRTATGMLAGIEDGDVRKVVTQLVDAHYTREEQMQADADKAAFESTYADVYNKINSPTPDIMGARAAVNKSGLPPTKQAELLEMITKGPVTEDDFVTQVELDNTWYKDPELFAAINLNDPKYTGKLTHATRIAMMERQAKIRGSLAKDQKAIDPVIEKANPIIERYLGVIGVDTGAKAKTADIHYENTIRSIVGTEIELLTKKLGREPSILEIEKDVIKPVFKTYRREGLLWGTNEVQLDDVLKDYQSNGLDATEASAALRRKGLPVNAETLNSLLDKWRQKEGK